MIVFTDNCKQTVHVLFRYVNSWEADAELMIHFFVQYNFSNISCFRKAIRTTFPNNNSISLHKYLCYFLVIFLRFITKDLGVF